MRAGGRPDSLWRLRLRRFMAHRLALGALVGLIFLALAVAGVSLWVSREASLRLDFAHKLLPPSWSHPFGTNELGQDMLVRCLYGGRVSLRVGLQSVALALVIGVALGGLAGLGGRRVDNLVMRLVDVMLAVPLFFVLLLLASYFGSSLWTVTLIIGLTSWTEVCRLVRADLLSLRERTFVEAARALGAGRRRLLLVHVLPNAASSIIVAGTLGFARAIIVESALSYLGFGVQPPDVSWGYMLRNAQAHMSAHPWLALFPGALIFLTVLACNFVGDGLRDALDPRIHRFGMMNDE